MKSVKQQLATIFLAYIRFFARLALFLNRPTIIGVAGSVGKSSTRNAITAALKEHRKVKMIYGNSETGLPLGILGIQPSGYSIFHWLFMAIRVPFGIRALRGVEDLVVEMGIDGPHPPKNMGYLLSFVKPDIAISMNIGATHTMLFEELLTADERKLSASAQLRIILDAMAMEDTRIIRESGCRVGIYNVDDEYVSRQMEKYAPDFGQRLLRFGSGDSVQARLLTYVVGSGGTRFEIELHTEDQHEQIHIDLKSYVLPEVYWENIAVAVLVAGEVGILFADAAVSLQKHFSLPKSRSSLLQGKNNTIIIDSSYNSSRIAMEPFLTLLQRIGWEEKRERILVMGDMRELGNEAQQEHEALLPQIQESADRVYCVGPLTKQWIVPALKGSSTVQEVRWFATSKELGGWLAAHLPERAVLCVKGSQNEIFLEEGIKPLLQNPAHVESLCRQESYWVKP